MKLIGKVFRRLERIKNMVYSPINRLYLILHGASVGKKLRVRGILFVRNQGNLIVGNQVRINSAGWANPIGAGERTFFQIMEKGRIVFEDGCAISNSAFTSASEIWCEKNVMIGSGCKVYDTDFHPLDAEQRIRGANENAISKPIRICENAFIGVNSMILKGVTIGKNSIIGAGSVVTKSVPENEIWAGNPARYIKKIIDGRRE